MGIPIVRVPIMGIPNVGRGCARRSWVAGVVSAHTHAPIYIR